LDEHFPVTTEKAAKTELPPKVVIPTPPPCKINGRGYKGKYAGIN